MKPFRYLWVLVRVIFHLLAFRPRICYMAIAATAPAFYKDSLVAMLLKLSGAKIVYHFHNKGVKTKQENKFDDLLYSMVFNKAQAILLSPYLYSDIEKYFPQNRVFYCPNGVPKVTSGAPDTSAKRTGRTEILFLSNLITSKGIFDLLKAIKILKHRHLNFHLTIVGGEGDIDNKTLAEKLRQLKIEDLVTYAGKKFGEEKKQTFFDVDIFAFPTYNECFPLVLLEAMQFSLPVISTYEGGIPEIVEDTVTGLLIKQRDVNMLSKKLEFLIKNPEERKKMGQGGYERYKKNFTLKLFEERMTEVLTKIAAQAPPSA